MLFGLALHHTQHGQQEAAELMVFTIVDDLNCFFAEVFSERLVQCVPEEASQEAAATA